VRVKFIAPVYPGDTVTTRGRVTDSRPDGAGQRLTVDVACENQDGALVFIGEASALVE
jgi:3-hydroxybutyryl-CoA dehydratase